MEVVGRVACDARREEVESHVPPIAALLRVALLNRHQFHRRDAEFLQIRNLFDQPGEGSAVRGIDPGVGARREAFDVQFIDDEIVTGPGRTLIVAVVGSRRPGQHSERRTSVVPGLENRKRDTIISRQRRIR